ncbi:hypothetical protein U1Q18_038753 [Sarracenia purpurea var. burkii]
MAVEYCSVNSGLAMSPRISFSYDLSQSDVIVPAVEHRLFRSNSASAGVDFNFCIRESYDQEPSSADELFSDGKMLPTQIKKKTAPPKQTDQPPEPSPPSMEDHEDGGGSPRNDRELKETKTEGIRSDHEKQNSKSFWRFKRSSSLNCGSAYARSLCPMPLLSRRNSTGSATTGSASKRSSSSSSSFSSPKMNPQKNSSSSSSSSSSYSGNYNQKPPLKRSTYGSYGNGVRVNPILNVPSVKVFGLGSIFFTGKDKTRSRRNN